MRRRQMPDHGSNGRQPRRRARGRSKLARVEGCKGDRVEAGHEGYARVEACGGHARVEAFGGHARVEAYGGHARVEAFGGHARVEALAFRV